MEHVHKPISPSTSDSSATAVLTEEERIEERALRELAEMAARRSQEDSELSATDATEQETEEIPKIAVEAVREETADVLELDEVEAAEEPELDLDEEMPNLASEIEEKVFEWSDLAQYTSTLLGQGRQCKVSRLVHNTTGEKLLLFEALPGMEEKLSNHVNVLEKLTGHPHFLKLHTRPNSSDNDTDFMVCEDPGSVSLTERLETYSTEQRMDLVRQLISAFTDLHTTAGKLHTDPFPKQLFVTENGDSLSLILSDFGDAEDIDRELSICQNSLLQETDNETALFNCRFASADKGRGLPYDQQSEIEVVARIAAWVLTNNQPIDGVRTTLEEFRESQDDLSLELEDMILRLTVAADKNREIRYKTMSDFCKALISNSKKKLDAGKSLGVNVDFDNLTDPVTVAHLRKALGDIDPEDLDPRIVKAFESLKTEEEEMVSKIKLLSEELDKDDYHFLRTCMQFPSEKIQSLAVLAAYKSNGFLEDDELSSECIQLVYNYLESGDPKLWGTVYEMHIFKCYPEYRDPARFPSITPVSEIDIALRLLQKCFSTDYLMYRTIFLIRFIERCLVVHQPHLTPDHYAVISGQLSAAIADYGSTAADKYKDISKSLEDQYWHGQKGNRFTLHEDIEKFRKELPRKTRGKMLESHVLREFVEVISPIISMFGNLLAEEETHKQSIVDSLLSAAQEINELDDLRDDLQAVDFMPDICRELVLQLFNSVVVTQLRDGNDQSFFDTLDPGSSLYAKIPSSMIAKAMKEGVIPTFWALNFLDNMEASSGQHLSAETLGHIMPPCDDFDPSVHQERLAFVLSRKHTPNRVKTSGKYHELIRIKLRDAVTKGHDEEKAALLAELKDFVDHRTFVELCLDEGYTDVAFDALGQRGFTEIKDISYLVNKVDELIREDDNLPRSTTKLAMRKINRGEKLDIRDTEYDCILGQVIEHLSKHFNHLMRRYIQPKDRDYGYYDADYTDDAYEFLDKVFSLLSIITKSNKEEDQGVFEKTALGLLELFRDDHPAFFDQRPPDGAVGLLYRNKLKSHPRRRSKYINSNPQMAIKMRDKYAGL